MTLLASAAVLILFCLQFSFTVTESQGFSKDICRSMVAMLDTDHSGKLGLEEFKTLLNDIAKWKVSGDFDSRVVEYKMILLLNFCLVKTQKRPLWTKRTYQNYVVCDIFLNLLLFYYEQSFDFWWRIFEKTQIFLMNNFNRNFSFIEGAYVSLLNKICSSRFFDTIRSKYSNLNFKLLNFPRPSSNFTTTIAPTSSMLMNFVKL